MANQKQGLNYYTIDTDRYQDIRIKRLKKNLGGLGVAVYDYILCEIYRVRGYFFEWDEDTLFDIAEYWGVKESLVQEIVKYCGAVGLFDKELLSRGIVTSESIQKRYLDMCARAKRIPPQIPESLRRITEECRDSSEECTDSSEECGDSSEGHKEKESTQRKRKENKEKKSKVNKNNLSLTPSYEVAETEEADESAERERILSLFFLRNFKKPQEEVDRFYAHYSAQGWKRGGGIPIKNRVALAESWSPTTGESRFTPPTFDFLAKVYYSIPDHNLRYALIHHIADMRIEGDKVVIYCSSIDARTAIEEHSKEIAPIYKGFFPNTSLIYRIAS